MPIGESFQSALNSLANTPQSVQTFFDFSKELFQNLYLWLLNGGILVSSIVYIGLIFVVIRAGIALYQIYTFDVSRALKLLYGVNKGLKSIQRARTATGTVRAIDQTSQTIRRNQPINR